MEVYILRHGQAEDARGGPDSERALTTGGREMVGVVSERARQGGASPTLVLCSPFKRALETAEIAAKALEYSAEIVRTNALTPSGSPEDVWGELRSRPNEHGVLLVGHEPLLGSLVAHLLGSPALQTLIVPAALLAIDLGKVSGTPRGVLRWMIDPSLG